MNLRLTFADVMHRVVVAVGVAALVVFWLITPANAALVARAGENSIALLNESCADAAVIARMAALGVDPNALRVLRRATLVIGGVPFEACFLVHEGIVYFIDEEGRSGAVPGVAFENEEGA